MKLVKVFALFLLLHVAGWAAAHVFLQQRAREVLIVADTSFAMKSHFPAMEGWINNYADSSRYKKIIVASDKAMLGDLSELRSTSQIFRANYGRIKEDSLQKYESLDVVEKFLLSDGTIKPSGWSLITFPP